MSYVELKKALYVFLSWFGVLLVCLAWRPFQADDIAQQISAAVLMISGCGLTLFSLLTLALRDDPDVWR